MGELTRCAKHGLAFDPAVQVGCTICRREQSQRPPPPDGGGGGSVLGRLFFVITLLSASSGAYYLYKKLNKPPPAAIGGACTAESGCQEGGDCMSGSFGLEKYGRCYRRCVTDDTCAGSGQRCSSGHCMDVAGANAGCGGDVACTDGTECISLTGLGPRCIQRCSFMSGADACPAGTTCTRVMNAAMPTNPTLASDWCVPNR